MSMNEIALYMHAGSGNHGCEAIVDSLVRLLPVDRFTLMTNCAAEDERYLPAEVKARTRIIEEQHIDRNRGIHAAYYAYRKVTKDQESFLRYRYRALTGSRKPALAISIGGDNYCYPSMIRDLIRANAMFNHQQTATVLLGCSIEPELLTKDNKELLEDLHRYCRIIARETISYEALRGALQEAYGPEAAGSVLLCPDPAFSLPSDESGLPEGFESGNTVGINLSPMVEDYAADPSAPLAAYTALIEDILQTTNMKVALIPHVVWNRSNDRVPLRKLHERFQSTGRVQLVEDMSAEKLKGVIANCRFFIGARTHATIAAYSTIIPTLVIGYSVKARGIARDLFGTEENYVLPVQSLKEPQQLLDAWHWLQEHEDETRYQLAGSATRLRAETGKIAEEIHRVLQELR